MRIEFVLMEHRKIYMHCEIHHKVAVVLEGCRLIPRFCPGFRHLQYRPGNKAKLFKHHNYLIQYCMMKSWVGPGNEAKND